jgi:hypothetical protein
MEAAFSNDSANGMLGALQESATFTAYNLQRNKAREAGDVVLEAIFLFKMPGDGLIPDYRLRLESSGAGISPRDFLARVVWPLLTTLKISREEIGRALTRRVAANPD